MSPFIDGSRLSQANANAKKRSEFTDKLPIFPVGPHNVKLTGVKALKNEKSGQTEIHIEVTDPNGVYRTITEVLRIAPKDGDDMQQYHDINLQILANYFLSAFGHEELKNSETMAGFVKQFSPYVNKDLQIVVQHHQRVMEPKNPGESMTLFEEAHIWYTGDISKEQLNYKIAESIRPLSAKEQAMWNNWTGPKKVAKGVNTEIGTTAVAASVNKPKPDYADKGTPENAEAETTEEDESAEVEGDVKFED